MSEPAQWVFPASYGQERVWLASQLQPGSSVYNVAMTVPLPPGASLALAVSALGQVVARHEALRTALRAESDGLAQVVHAEVPVEVAHDTHQDDLRGAPDVESRFYARCLAEARLPFALDRAPLWRARLIRAGADDWRLVVVCHHTICDGTSWGILGAELTEICGSAPRPPRLPELSIQYADWAVWQRSEQLTPARLERELAYWRGRLASAPPVHSVPTDRPRGPVQDYAGAEVRFEIPAELAGRVTRLAQRLRVTEFAVLFAAYAVLLSRLGGQADVVAGVPIAGRGQPQAAPLIGMFVNTVVLRADAAPDRTFTELAGQVAAATLEALEHAAVPVQRVVEELVPRRDPGVAPLYQVGFNHLPGVPLNSGYGTARDELTLELSGREGRVEYRTGLFDAASARAIAARYLRVLDAVTSQPGLRVSDVPLLDAAERAVLLGFGEPDRPGEPGESAGPGEADDADGVADAATVTECILGRAARNPNAIAIRAGGASLSYADLAGRARALAGRLRDLGVGPERLVMIALPRSPELVVSVLAVLLAGGGYLPADPAWPAERLEFLLADSGATVLMTAVALTAGLPTAGGLTAPPGVTVLDIADEERCLPPDSPRIGAGSTRLPAGPGNLAYVIYTSGSTGRPKGTAIEHRSLANYVRWFNSRFALGPADRVLASTAPSFDAFGIELFPALVAGGTVVMAPEPAGLDPDALLRLAAAEGVTMIATVPTVLRMLVDSPVLSECRAVRQVVVGGEQLSGELAADLARRLPVPLHNLYGPTETTIDVSSHTCLPGIAPPKAAPSEATPTGAGPPGPVPIGRPLAGARLYVLDQAGGLAPLGVIGHLHAGGVPVGRGYPGRPALTAERFVPDPFGPPGSRLYRTGDLARWTGDGDLQFMGRIDAQVKIRGLRVEPAEVEAVLREQPGVRDAAVLVRDEGPGDQRLVAYVLAEAGAGPLGAALRAALRRSLPDYLVPAAIVSLGSFPLTSHGKLDVAWLPAPDYAAAAAQRYQEPQTASERLIAGVWAEVLGLERVGSADDFFDLGGHSLLAARIAVRLTDLLGTQVPIHLFFSHVTVRDLAAAVEELMAAEISELSGQEVASMLQELQT